MLLVNYGRHKFDLKKFDEIKNRNWNKPYGGFWASPVTAKYGWKEWCKSERYKIGRLRCKIFLKLTSKKILTINTLHDLITKFDWIEKEWGPSFKSYYPDFEKMAKKYDAIYLTEHGQWKTRLSQPYSLYGWDCECVLVLNGKKLKQIKDVNQKKKNTKRLAKVK